MPLITTAIKFHNRNNSKCSYRSYKRWKGGGEMITIGS